MLMVNVEEIHLALEVVPDVLLMQSLNSTTSSQTNFFERIRIEPTTKSQV
mgnify:CR=1 FL=1